ncbi:MAG: penicillin acylase family protein, partial [Anaerolineae bacterium]|nr:penicillin acylase family protein [Anaerolineae bacterium]
LDGLWAPLLAGDLHLPLSLPAPHYAMGLHCLEMRRACDLNVLGLTWPGVPSILSGHNDYVAWTVTPAGVDTQDAFVLRTDPADSTRYAWDNTWRTLTLREGALYPEADDLAEQGRFPIASTHFGPVISDALEVGEPLALRSDGLHTHRPLAGAPAPEPCQHPGPGANRPGCLDLDPSAPALCRGERHHWVSAGGACAAARRRTL